MTHHDPIKISVVIPVLNAAATLAKTFESIVAQKYENIELIVIDGGSTDGTLEIIQQYLPRLAYWESGLDSGIANAFNRGIRQASGELIAILNADDNWVSDTLQHVANAVKANPHADVYCGQVRYVDDSTGNCYVRKPDMSRMKQRMFVFHPAMFVKKAAYIQVGDFSEQYLLAMDSEWCHRAMAANLTFFQIDRVLAEMYLGGVSDRHFLGSLWEYRKSLIQHKLTSRFLANYYFVKFMVLKTAMCSHHLRLLKQLVFQ